MENIIELKDVYKKFNVYVDNNYEKEVNLDTGGW